MLCNGNLSTPKVTQYSCDFPNKAPQGCLQYFYGSTTGTVRSFNQGGSPAYHLANQKQSICIRYLFFSNFSNVDVGSVVTEVLSTVILLI